MRCRGRRLTPSHPPHSVQIHRNRPYAIFPLPPPQASELAHLQAFYTREKTEIISKYETELAALRECVSEFVWGLWPTVALCMALAVCVRL